MKKQSIMITTRSAYRTWFYRFWPLFKADSEEEFFHDLPGVGDEDQPVRHKPIED